MNTSELIRAIRIFFGNYLEIDDWKDYQPMEFSTLEDMEKWFVEKTKEYAKKLVPDYTGEINVKFHVFPASVSSVEGQGGSWVVTKVTTGNCESTINRASGEVKKATISYNQNMASRMCMDCLENLIIHEVLHIRYPVHHACFQRAFKQAVKNKYAEHGDPIPDYRCLTCREKTFGDRS